MPFGEVVSAPGDPIIISETSWRLTASHARLPYSSTPSLLSEFAITNGSVSASYDPNGEGLATVT